ncbi:hypothetical protein [Sulfuriferula plumbiphila]|nr:hypothetical protein [Sulfuriferula plumbiphila]
MKKTWMHVHFRLAMLLALLFPLAALAGSPKGIAQTSHLPGGTDVPVTVFPAKGQTLLLWLPSESGLAAAEYRAAAALAKTGTEVWLPDLQGAYFLPVVPSSLQKIPVADVVRLITVAQQRSRKAVYLVTEGRSAALALQAAAGLHKSRQKLRGAILLSPNLYVETPAPGEEAEYLSVASRTKLPVVILQAENSPWKWRVEQLRSHLEQGGSKVKVVLLPGVRDRFYFRDDALPPEQALAARLPELVQNAEKTLEGKR